MPCLSVHANSQVLVLELVDVLFDQLPVLKVNQPNQLSFLELVDFPFDQTQTILQRQVLNSQGLILELVYLPSHQ